MDIMSLVKKVITDAGYGKSRAAKMEINDLLKCVLHKHATPFSSDDCFRLLSAFHDVGIHFS
jgi:hypothetical protein